MLIQIVECSQYGYVDIQIDFDSIENKDISKTELQLLFKFLLWLKTETKMHCPVLIESALPDTTLTQ